MRHGKRLEEWDQLSVLLATVRGIMGDRVKAIALNPYRAKPQKTKEMLDRESERAWRILENGLRNLNRGKG